MTLSHRTLPSRRSALSRRKFIEGIGVAIASLLLSRCSPVTEKGRIQTPRDRLRDCWMRFDWLAQQTQEDWKGEEAAREPLSELIADHQAALNEMVAAGELDQAVADQVQSAFGAAAYHVWRSNAPITCYEPVLVDYQPASSAQLVHQAQLLGEMAKEGVLDPDMAARAQYVVQRDIAFLALSSAEKQALYTALTEAAGDTFDYPEFSELELDIPPEAVQAADFLSELLLKDVPE